MAKRLAAVLGLALVCSAAVLMAQQFPFWELLLHYSGKTDETPVPSMMMGNHMQMSQKGKAEPGDEERAQHIIVAARGVLVRYADVNTALAGGYKPFHPTGRMGEEVHYTNYRNGRFAKQHVNYEQPTSILYKRMPEGMKAMGVMYTAPQDATADELNTVVPLSIASWHRHVDFCGGPRSLSIAEQFGPTRAVWNAREYSHRSGVQTGRRTMDSGGLWLDGSCLSQREGAKRNMGWQGHAHGSQYRQK